MQKLEAEMSEYTNILLNKPEGKPGREYLRKRHIKRGMVKCRSLAWTRKCHTILKLLFTKSKKRFIIKL